MSEETTTTNDSTETGTEQETWIKWRMFDLDNSVIVSSHDDSSWHIGEMRSKNVQRTSIACCHYGFHCSDDIQQARGNITGAVVARVQVSGEHDIRDDKSSWEHMTILEAWIIPGRDGLAARLNAMLASDMYVRYAKLICFEPWDIDNEDFEYDHADSYAFSSVLETLKSILPDELLFKAYEELVRTFMPLAHKGESLEEHFTEVNKQLDKVTTSKKSVYTADELQSLYNTVSALQNICYSQMSSNDLDAVIIPLDTFSQS